jgi:hypothetical protein
MAIPKAHIIALKNLYVHLYLMFINIERANIMNIFRDYM